tara:strand:+ start:244 stop:1377 length:1134 start_codon:yes stop_codon:yes gene_type:complete
MTQIDQPDAEANRSSVEATYLDKLRNLGVDPDKAIPADMDSVRTAMRSAGVMDDVIDKVIEMAPKTIRERYHQLMKPIQCSVEADAKLIKATWKGEILVGGIPSHSLNASSQKVSGGYLILVHDEFTQLLHQAAKVFVHSSNLIMVSAGVDDVPISLADRLCFSPSDWTKEYAMTAVTDMYRCLKAGNINDAMQHSIFSGQAELTFYDQLLDYAKRYVVSHEFAHVIHGHCEEDEDLSGSHYVARKRQIELDADQLAVALMFAMVDLSKNETVVYQDAAMRAAGIAFAFLTCWLADCCSNLHDGLYWHEERQKSYPHFQRRFQNARSFIKKRYGPVTGFMDTVFLWAWGTVLPIVGELNNDDELRVMGSVPPSITFD